MLASGNSGALTQAEAQLRSLSSMQQRIARSDVGGLVALRADVAATVSAAQSAAQQTAASTSSQAQAAVLYQADQAARQSTADFMRDYYDKHIFDKYLKFTSREDEEEYRHREEQRKHEIEEARNQHTPQGDLRAIKLSIDQTKDAGAHGAASSPEYQRTLSGLENSASQLSAQIDTAKVRTPTSDQRAATAAQDKSALEQVLTPDLLAHIRSAKIAAADQNVDGHGITVRQPTSTASRTPS